jgi:hypothetical protein
VTLALIRTVVERVPDDQLNPNLTRYIQYQYATMLTLLPTRCRSQLPIENQFFNEYFRKMILPQSKIKFFTLWRKIRDGLLSIDEAVALLPRKDMVIAGMKAKRVRSVDEAGGSPPVTMQDQSRS